MKNPTQPPVSVYWAGNEHSRVHKKLDCLLWSVHLFVWAQVPVRLPQASCSKKTDTPSSADKLCQCSQAESPTPQVLRTHTWQTGQHLKAHLWLQGICMTRMCPGKQTTPSALCCWILSTKAICSTKDYRKHTWRTTEWSQHARCACTFSHFFPHTELPILLLLPSSRHTILV